MWKLYEQICLETYFYKNIHISLFDKYFYKDKKSKLYFRDRAAIQNNFTFLVLREYVVPCL